MNSSANMQSLLEPFGSQTLDCLCVKYIFLILRTSLVLLISLYARSRHVEIADQELQDSGNQSDTVSLANKSSTASKLPIDSVVCVLGVHTAQSDPCRIGPKSYTYRLIGSLSCTCVLYSTGW